VATTLSRRELQVLHGLADGCSHKEIAQRLELAPDTITSYRKNLYRKLQVSSRSAAVALGQQSGLLPPATPPAASSDR